MKINDCKDIIKNTNVLKVLEIDMSPEKIIKWTNSLKGFRPREGFKGESISEWILKYRDRVESLKELHDFIESLIKKLKAIKEFRNFTNEKLINLIICAFREFQNIYSHHQNLNSFKYGALKTLKNLIFDY